MIAEALAGAAALRLQSHRSISKIITDKCFPLILPCRHCKAVVDLAFEKFVDPTARRAEPVRRSAVGLVIGVVGP